MRTHLLIFLFLLFSSFALFGVAVLLCNIQEHMKIRRMLHADCLNTVIYIVNKVPSKSMNPRLILGFY